MQIRKVLSYAKRLTGNSNAINALTKGSWADRALLAGRSACESLHCSLGHLIRSERGDDVGPWEGSGTAPGPFATTHAYCPTIADYAVSAGIKPASAVRILPATLQYHGSPAHVAVRGLLGQGNSRRSYTFASYSCSPGPVTAIRPQQGDPLSAGNLHEQIAEANAILQTVDILRFRERLELESETTQRLSMSELMALCKESGAAQTDEEAGRVCEALAHAGIVLRFGDCVFLRPQDVVEIMMRAVPDLEEEVVARLKELEAELKPLEAQNRKIEMRAFRRSHGVLWAGLGFLILQWGIFLHFTYSELSWDVVEPVTYFTSQLWAILGYCYFLATKEDFAYRHAHSKINQNFTVGGERDHGFDRARYQRLLREHSRYRRYLRIPAAEGQ